MDFVEGEPVNYRTRRSQLGRQSIQDRRGSQVVVVEEQHVARPEQIQLLLGAAAASQSLRQRQSPVSRDQFVSFIPVRRAASTMLGVMRP